MVQPSYVASERDLNKWAKLHGGHVGLKIMLYRSKIWGLSMSHELLIKQLAESRVCQKHRVCMRDTKLGTLNDSSRPGEVLGMDYVAPMDGKYLPVKVDFFCAWFKLDVCPIAYAASTLQGIVRWERKFGLVQKLVIDQGKHFKNSDVENFYKQKEVGMKYSVAYHHRNHKLMERYNRFVLQLLHKLCSERENKCW